MRERRRDSIRLRILQRRSPPRKKETRPQPSPQSPSQAEQQAKPLNQNDLLKWIVISDAPDYAAAESQWRNSKNFPVMARSPTYLDRFGKRDLQLGLKCLRAMNECAQQEKEKLEKQAEALGCVALTEMEGSGIDEEASAASTATEVETSEKSRTVVLRFGQSFYRAKVLPFIQACLIAEDSSFDPQVQSPRTPAALAFPDNIKHDFESPRQLHEARAAYDTAARRRLSLVRKRDAPAVKLSPEPANAESDSAVLEFPPTPAAYADGDEAFAAAAKAWQTESQQSQSQMSESAAEKRDRSATPSECPPTPRAPDVNSSPGMLYDATSSSLLQLDAMDVDAIGGDDGDGDGNGPATSESAKFARTDTPMAETSTATTPSFASPALLEPTACSTLTTNTTTTTHTPATAPLPMTDANARWPPFSTPQQPPLRRSTRSTQHAKTSDSHGDASHRQQEQQQQQPVARMTVWQLQREILRLCAERERALGRNERLREWLRGVEAALRG